jgi:STE24 endopeptidase
MIHALLIAVIILTLARDGLRWAPLFSGLPDWLVVVGSLAPLALLAMAAQGVSILAGRRLDRIGSWRSVAAADWAIAWARGLAVLSYAVSILALGWLDLVRSWLGANWIMVDEAIAVAPVTLVFIAGWWSYYPIERRVREAAILRRLDVGFDSPATLPTRWEYVGEQTRHQVLFIFAPVAMIGLWTEGLDLAISARLDTWPWLSEPWGEATVVALHFAGVIGVLILMPLVLRVLWNTVPLGPSAIRDRLLALCRTEGVRCRDLLVWRTRSGMLNGAVVGLVPALRYILLTDALLERLPETEIEAVMAHEVAHARRHHLPWLMIAMLAAVGSGWALSWKLFSVWLGAEHVNGDGVAGALAAITSLGAAVAAGFLIFGFVSRRFEQQADAFAAQHISGWTKQTRRRRDIRIAPEAVAAMSGALGRVAAYNHIPPARFSWRHGSIRSRQARLQRLLSLPAHALPIDRMVSAIKMLSLLALAAVIALAMSDPALAPI